MVSCVPFKINETYKKSVIVLTKAHDVVYLQKKKHSHV